MKKPLIAVDIDDVLTHSAEAVIEFSNSQWNMNLTINDFDEDWRKLWGLSPEEEAEMHRRSLEIRTAEVIGGGLVPRQDAERVLVQLACYADVVAVTSRRRTVETATRRWIDHYVGGAVKKIYFAGIYDEDTKHATHDARIAATKHDILSTVKPDYFIDDQPKHCEAALELGIKTIIFGNYPWNKNTDIEKQGAVRCPTWRDVEEYFIKQGVLKGASRSKKKLFITRLGNPVLRKVAKRLTKKEIVSADVQEMIASMFELLGSDQYGVGLAAPQVGRSVALSVIGIKPTPTRPNLERFDTVIINPTYEGIGKRTGLWEGCISCGTGDDTLYAKVPRFQKINAEWQDIQGTKHIQLLDGFVAHVFQHETDHLNGVLFVDRVKDTKTFMMADEYRTRVARKQKS